MQSAKKPARSARYFPKEEAAYLLIQDLYEKRRRAPAVRRAYCRRGDFGMISDTQMLNHVYQTAEMGRTGILSVLKYAEDPKLSQALRGQLQEYKQIQDDSARMLRERGVRPQEVSQVMSAVQAAGRSRAKIAEMMIRGSTMGVTKSLHTLHGYSMADERVCDVANKLLETEEHNIEQMKPFL